jgi:integrase
MPRLVAIKAGPMTARPAASPVTMAMFADEIDRHYLAKNAGPTMLRNVRRVLKILVQVNVHTTSELNDSAIQRFEAALPDISAHGRFELLRTLRAVCNHGVRLGLLASTPTFPAIPHPPDIPKANRISFPSMDEMNLYLKYLRSGADATWEGHRGYALVATIVFAGLLRNEVMSLQINDIDLIKGTIRIRRREGLKKGWLRSSIGSQNPVRISDKLKPILAAWLPLTGSNDVFPGKRGAGAWKQGSKASDAHGWIKAAALAAGVKTKINFEVLHRFHVVNAVSDIPDIEPLEPIQSRGHDRSGDDAQTLESLHELDIDEATRLMALLRRQSATWKGNRLYAAAALPLLAGLSKEEVLNLLVENVYFDRSKPMLIIGDKAPIILTADAAVILRRWLNRPDRGQMAHVFSGIASGNPWVGNAKNHGLRYELSQAALEVAIPGRVTIECLRRLWRRCGGYVQLGEAWRAIADPEPIIRSEAGHERHEPATLMTSAIERRQNLATWDPPIPAVMIEGQKDPVFVRGVNVGILGRVQYQIIKALIEHHPNPDGLTRDQIARKFGLKSVRQILDQLMKDSVWQSVIRVEQDDDGRNRYRLLDV